MPDLDELQRVLDREIPLCRQMGVRVIDAGDDMAGLRMAMPLGPNRNHQQTAFAGSLNALCTIVGWGATYLELQRIGSSGVVVIRRSGIKYHEPVDDDEVVAGCVPPAAHARQYFAEMLAEKGQSKFDLTVEIAGSSPDRPAVAFSGSYVVLPAEP